MVTKIRKTIDIELFIGTVNYRLAMDHPPLPRRPVDPFCRDDAYRSYRQGLIDLTTTFLHEAHVYAGFNYLPSEFDPDPDNPGERQLKPDSERDDTRIYFHIHRKARRKE